MKASKERQCQLKGNTEREFIFNIFSTIFSVVRDIKKFQI